MEDEKVLVEEGEIHDDDNDPNKDDIPDNFFDDFNNEGFMESLQIVDSLDDTNAAQETEEDNEEAEVIIAEDEIVDKSSNIKKSRRSKGRRRSKSREKRSRRESPSKRRKFDETALRRDPDKTRKALEKDRENFFKKKEQKVISKIVETGLVPPGMESEVNLSAIESSKKEVEKADKEKSNSNKRRSREIQTSREKRISISKERRGSVSRERRRSVSRERRRRRSRSRSVGRYRSRSIGKRRDRSAEIRKSFDRRLRSRSRSRGRNFDQNKYSSPNQIRRRRTRSRSVSDRERWLRERDPSPERKYQGLLKEKKMSFLEEIKMKLNGNLGSDNVIYPNPKNPVQPKFPQDVYSEMGPSVPIGTVQPPPPHYNQNYLINNHPVVAPVNAKYNEEFFIGNQNVANVPPPMMPMEHQNMIPIVGNGNNVYAASAAPVPAPTDTSEISAKVSELIARISASTKTSSNQSGSTSQKVDKPMSLTDFLHINPTPEFSSQSQALKKKIDVLSRCQDFLKELSGDKKNNGKLRVTCTSKPKNKAEQNISPLLRQKPLKFSFNTPLSENSYQELLNRALMKTGIVSEVIDLVDDEKDASPPSAPTVTKRKLQSDFNSEQSRYMSKMCQTDPIRCDNCEIRKSVQYKSIGIQCGETERFNVGVQVVEEDIDLKLGKNQSLAHMTPAQLLGRSDPVSTRADHFADRMPLPPYRGDAPYWNQPRDYYIEPVRDYYGIPRDPSREPRFPRY